MNLTMQGTIKQLMPPTHPVLTRMPPTLSTRIYMDIYIYISSYIFIYIHVHLYIFVLFTQMLFDTLSNNTGAKASRTTSSQNSARPHQTMHKTKKSALSGRMD